MKISEMMEELQWIKDTEGDIPIQFSFVERPGADDKGAQINLHHTCAMFIVAEDYVEKDNPDKSKIVYIRNWPY